MIKVSQGCLAEEELAEVREAFAYGYFGMAHKVFTFEERLKEYLGAAQVVTTSTGTAALHLALAALDIGLGDEVIVPSLTFVASFQAIRATGAMPVACDIEPDTLQLDVADTVRRITPRTKGIMPVHYAGNPCNMDALLDLAASRKLRIIEDAAHAFGATYRGRKIGSFGDIACFSFDSIKNITCGEGGAVACRDAVVADAIRQMRQLGVKSSVSAAAADKRWNRAGPFDVVGLGFRFHLSNINAAIGLAQLKKVEQFLARRRTICRQYDAAFAALDGVERLRINYEEAAPHVYVIRVHGGLRDGLKRFLEDRGVETAINYVPNHLHSYFRSDGLSLPETERAYAEILTLPLHCALTDAQVAAVIAAVREFFENGPRGER
jgi:dTDP-4-amino-4,6-dideoxygalactose transaminase